MRGFDSRLVGLMFAAMGAVALTRPSAKKAMAEKGVSRDQVTGSGRDGRVMKEDVARAAQAPAPQPQRTEEAHRAPPQAETGLDIPAFLRRQKNN